MSVGVPHLVREKSHHSRMSISAHRGTISCIEIQAQGYGYAPRVYTAGEDGALRMWDGRSLSLIVETSSLTRHRISCMCVSGQKVYMGTSGGEIIITGTDGSPISHFTPHKGIITCMQVVNRGRIFTGSMDGSVKFIGEDAEVIRQFPLNPNDSQEPILSVKATSANLIFTGSDRGVIRVYNLRQELQKVLRTSSLEGVPLNLMEVIHVNNKVSIIVGHKTNLTMWYLTLVKDNFDEYEINVDAVKTISSRMRTGRITSMKAVFVNPLRTNRPCVYLGNSNGLVQIIVPTGKSGSVYDQYNRRVLAPKFKQYAFKDVAGTVTYVCAGGGRIYAGTAQGTLYMWKECLAMLNLRKWSAGRPDTHGYKGNLRSSTSSRQSVTVLLEPEQDEPSSLDAESLQSFAKVADSDISESEFENDLFAEPVLISLSESIPDRAPSQRSQRASTAIHSSSPGNSQRSSSFIHSPIQTPSPSSTFSSAIQTPPPNLQRPSSTLSQQHSMSTPLVSNPPRMSSDNYFSDSSRNTSNSGISATTSMSSGNVSQGYAQEIIQLLQDSAADLASLPPIRPSTTNMVDNLSNSMQHLSTSEPSRQVLPSYQEVASSNYGAPLLPPMSAPSHQAPTPPISSQPSAAPQQSEEETRCVVCLDTKRDSILYQCGHVCTCFSCGKELISRGLKCPMCRAPIKDCIVLYR